MAREQLHDAPDLAEASVARLLGPGLWRLEKKTLAGRELDRDYAAEARRHRVSLKWRPDLQLHRRDDDWDDDGGYWDEGGEFHEDEDNPIWSRRYHYTQERRWYVRA